MTIQPTYSWGPAVGPFIDPGPVNAQSTTQGQPIPVAWSPESPSFYFEDESHQASFSTFRNQRKMSNTLSRPGPSWTEEDELKLVDTLWLEWFGEHYPANQSWAYDNLNLDALEAKPLRKHELRPFKIEYETYQEIKLRLLNTVIAIKGHPFLVQKIAVKPDGFQLAVSDGLKTYVVKYSDLVDLRSLPPMYIQTQANQPGWLCRMPGRVYQQGINRQNTIVKSIDSKATVAALDTNYFVRTFGKRQKRTWDPTIKSLLEWGEIGSVRLSDDVAVKSEKGKILACYKGRFLGKI
ncbi:MAG TPA: hypothetical protein VM260_17405, partial [Pirellula sp.]|nr:hypothetical protein [Pirellula sp.]